MSSRRGPALVVGRMLALLRQGFAAAPRLMWISAGLAVTSSLATALYPFGFKVLVDAVVRQDAVGLWAGMALTGGLIGVTWIATNLDATVGFGLVDRISLAVSTRIARAVEAPLGIEHVEHPEFVQAVELVELNRDQLSSAPRNVVTTIAVALRLLVVVALLASVDWRLALLPLFAVVPMVAETRAAAIRDRAEERSADDKHLADRLCELCLTASTAAEIRTYGLVDDLRSRHHQALVRIGQRTTRAALLGAAAAVAGWLVFLGTFMAGLTILARAAVDGRASVGDIVLVVVLAQQVRVIVGALSTAAGQLSTSFRAADRLARLEALGADGRAGTGPVPDRLVEGVTLEGVGLRYPGVAHTALADVDLHLPAGAVVALVGENGAGKSTLVKVLTGMYRPSSGRILVDGEDLAGLDVLAWRARMAVVFQDHLQLELVARETVGVGDLPRIDDLAAIEGALGRAGVAWPQVVVDDGPETPLGRSFAGGAELSRGQWQQLAVARGMMRREPLLLVLDEPATSLDPEAEHRLHQRYARAARQAAAAVGGITVLVSHRLSAVRDVDLIVVLDGGCIREVGTHDELMAADTTYAELIRLQEEGYRP